jgi:methylmalonyl-CoA carboxyltransferase large subunit
MRTEAVDSEPVAEALAAIRRELARLGERIAALEAGTGGKPRAAAPALPAAEAAGLSEELLLVISAAVAAFLGKKPHIRQIRLVGTTAWSQQGRVTIQASHALSARHGGSQP